MCIRDSHIRVRNIAEYRRRIVRDLGCLFLREYLYAVVRIKLYLYLVLYPGYHLSLIHI